MGVRGWFLGLRLNRKLTGVMVVFVMAPIITLVFILMRGMKERIIKDNINYMEYTIRRRQEQIGSRIDSINMVTRFFLKDEALSEVLKAAADGTQMTAREIVAFKHSGIASLERLVNNNPVLYGVRVYGINDRVQEIMPILYQRSRMEKQGWAGKVGTGRWNLGYRDAIYEVYEDENRDSLISLVTPVYDEEDRRIGTVEAVVTMKEMFPSLYENIKNQWSCVVMDEGSVYYGDGWPEDMKASDISARVPGKKSLAAFYMDADGRHLVVSSMRLDGMGASLLLIQDISGAIQKLTEQEYGFGFAIILLTVVMALLINLMVKLLLNKFYRIIASIREVRKGNLDIRFEESGRDEMSELGGQINKMMIHIRTLMEDGINREMLVKNSEIKALQNQINAHFIYNVLESIKMMAEIDERYDISDSITALGELLRYGMKWAGGNVTVEQELAYIRNYIWLMNLRYDFTIHLSVNMPERIHGQEIPKMSLQPVVENAICHGIEELAEDATIYIKAIARELYYEIEITDSGVGMSEEQVRLLTRRIQGDIEVSGGSGNGIGLKNVQDRIQLTFGLDYGITVASKESCYTKIIIKLPFTGQTGAKGRGDGGEKRYANLNDSGG